MEYKGMEIPMYVIEVDGVQKHHSNSDNEVIHLAFEEHQSGGQDVQIMKWDGQFYFTVYHLYGDKQWGGLMESYKLLRAAYEAGRYSPRGSHSRKVSDCAKTFTDHAEDILIPQRENNYWDIAENLKAEGL